MSPVFWDHGPPTPKPERFGVQIHVVPPGIEEYIRIIGPISPVWLHWDPTYGERGRSRPCMKEECAFCPKSDPIWAGYAPALLWRRNVESKKDEWIHIVLDITDAASGLMNRDLTGKIVKFWRNGTRRNSPLAFDVIEHPLDPAPPAFDVKPILEKVWGVHRRRRA